MKAFSDAVTEFENMTAKAIDIIGNVDTWLDRVTMAMKVLEAGRNLAGSCKDTAPEVQTLLGLSQVLDLAKNFVPPGVSDMLDFYSQAVKAIAGGIEFIRDGKGVHNLNGWAFCKSNIQRGTFVITTTGAPYGGAWAREIVLEDENGRKSKALSEYNKYVQGHQ